MFITKKRKQNRCQLANQRTTNLMPCCPWSKRMEIVFTSYLVKWNVAKETKTIFTREFLRTTRWKQVGAFLDKNERQSYLWCISFQDTYISFDYRWHVSDMILTSFNQGQKQKSLHVEKKNHARLSALRLLIDYKKHRNTLTALY